MIAARVIAGALCACSCAQVRMQGTSEPTADLRPRPPGLLRAGIARVDITPPAGASTFGHGPDARVAEGFWTRLYCRIFVLETDPNDRVVLVPCDLNSISAILHREVAERIRPIAPTSRLFMAATHTHAGPAHYFESPIYAGFSSSRRPGFDPEMVEFLAARIARGVEAASAAVRPAALRWARTEAWGLTRNRSLEAWNANPPPLPFVPPPELQLSAEEAAIDPSLQVLQLEAVDEERTRLLGPIGWLVLFAMHPTVLAASNRLFGGDVFAVTSRLLESELRRKNGGDPLVAVINTNEGDIVPVPSLGSTDDAIRIGRKLADRALATRPAIDQIGDFRTQVALDSRYLETDLPGAMFSAEDGTTLALCSEAEVGSGTAAGASDHPTSIAPLLGPEAAVDPERGGCQAPKRRMWGTLQGVFVTPSAFPTHAPFSLLRIDDAWLSFVPAEMTAQAGKQLNGRVLRIVRTQDRRRAHATVVGLANSYLQYVTSRSEYAVQAYEGASTLYGPSTADFFASQVSLLARSMMGEPVAVRIGEAMPFTWQSPPRRSRLPLARDEIGVAEMKEPRVQKGLCAIPGPAAPRPICFWWTDRGPAQVSLLPAPWLALVDAQEGTPAPMCNADRAPPTTEHAFCDGVDDRGFDFQTRVRGRAGDAWVWSTVMRLSGEEWSALRESSVRLRAGDAGRTSTVLSDAFGKSALPPPCSDAQVRFCLGADQLESLR